MNDATSGRGARWFSGVEWHESTPNSWLLNVTDCLKVEVFRHRSWKRLKVRTPWRISLFGNPFMLMDRSFEELEDAQYVAEREAFNHLGAMVRRFPALTPGWQPEKLSAGLTPERRLERRVGKPAVRRFKRALHKAINAEPTKLSAATRRALDYLETRIVTPGAFADAMGYRGLRRHAQAGARVLEGLKRRGYVEGFVPGQGDIWHYRLTAAGLRALKG